MERHIGLERTNQEAFISTDETESQLKALSPQIKEILQQLSTEPFLVNLLPHIIKFMESKSASLLEPKTKP